jgi:TIR domain
MPPDNDESKRRLRLFLCHSSGDKPVVRQLCEWLERDGFDPWLDEKKLLPAQRWADVIEDAVRASDVVVVCLSSGSVSKEGFLQREIKFALQVADEKPDDTMYIVPARLEPVELPRRFRELQAANLYEPDGYDRLKQSLAQRAAQVAAAPPKPTSGVRVLPNPKSDQPPGVLTKLLALAPWLGLHPLASLLVVAGVSFAGYALYHWQQRQIAVANELYSDGIASWKSLELRKAEDLLSQAAAAQPGDARILAAYSLSLNERGRELEARQVAKRAVNSESLVSREARDAVQGVYNEVTGNWQKAEVIYSKLWQHSGNDIENGLRLAHVQTLGGAPAKALQTLQQIAAPGSEDARVVLEKATAQHFLGQSEEESQTLYPLIDEHPARDLVRATALAERCWARYNQRDNNDSLNSALNDCDEAEEIFNDEEDAVGQARTLTRQAIINAAQGDKSSNRTQAATLYQSALEKQRRAITIASERGAMRDEAGGRQNLANMLMQASPPNPDAANAEYERSSELFQSLGDKAGVAGLENDAAIRQIGLCRYRDALASAKKAQQNWAAIDSASEAIALANMGGIHFYLGDVRESEDDMKAALLKSQDKLNVDKDNWLITLGEIYTEGAKFDLAEQCFKRGPCYDDRQPTTIHDDKLLPDAVLDYANLQIAQGNVAAAETLAASALKSAQAEQDAESEMEARSVLANALMAQGSGAALKGAVAAVRGIDPAAVADCRLAVALRLTLARVAGLSGDLEKEREQLGQAQQSAYDLGLTGYELEATLAQAGVELRSGKAAAASALAKQVVKQSSDRGLLALKTKAVKIAQQAGI